MAGHEMLSFQKVGLKGLKGLKVLIRSYSLIAHGGNSYAFESTKLSNADESERELISKYSLAEIKESKNGRVKNTSTLLSSALLFIGRAAKTLLDVLYSGRRIEDASASVA
jgi:hypothetical protein